MNYLKILFSIALPIILQNFLSSFVNMLDTIMVGQLGSLDIASVGLGNQIFFVMSIATFGIVSGGSIFIAQYWGKKDMAGVHRTMGITLILTAFISLFFFCAAIFCPELCLGIYTKDEEVIRRGSEYLRIVAPSYLFFGILTAFGQSLRSTEHVRLPMVATGISVVINGILNYVFIFGIRIYDFELISPHGIIGAAIATVIARLIEFVIVIIIPYVKKYEIAVAPEKFFNRQTGFPGRYVKIVFPVLLNETFWGIGASLQSSVYGHAGTDVVAAFNIMNTISNLVWTFFIGCGNATAIIIGKKIGEQKTDEARSLAKKIVGFLAGSASVLGLLLIPLAWLLPLFFKVEPEVIHMAQIMLYMTAFLYPLFAICMCMVVGVCRSGGDTVYGMFMDVGFMWLVALPLGFCAVNLWHFPFWAVFLCLHTEDFCKTTMGLLRLKSGKWLHDVTKADV